MLPDETQAFYERRLGADDALAGCIPDVVRAHDALAGCFAAGGTLLLAGNGGSFADCLHISGELLKRFERPRRLPKAVITALAGEPHGDVLAVELEAGLPAVVLGNNGALLTAVMNDKRDPRLALAQECAALGRAGDALLGISTSGNAEDVNMAMSVARAKGLTLVTLTGAPGGSMAARADVAVRTPGEGMAGVQEHHIRVYHALCAGIEAHFFPQDGDTA